MKNKATVLLLTFLLTLTATASFAQSLPCKTDEEYWKFCEEHPECVDELNQSRYSITQRTEDMTLDSVDVNEIVIPIVFHVVHQCGYENISDHQIHNAVEQLNLDFKGLHIDRLIDPTDPFISDTCSLGLKFELATKDPYGNATTGIHRFEHLSTLNASGMLLL